MKKYFIWICLLFWGYGLRPVELQGQSKKSSFRYATAQDAKSIHNANEGDYLLTGANIPQDNGVDVRPNHKNLFTLDNSTQQKKILIKGGEYDYVHIEVPGLSGTPENPIIITNYDGQVKTKRLTILGIKHFRITGKYDAKQQTGDAKYPGHDGGYAYSSGRYGIMVDRSWEDLKVLVNFSGSGDTQISDFEVDYIEITGGGFSNFVKWEKHTQLMENIKIHDCYIHDIHGEGIYAGSTQADPQHQLKNFKFYNNRVLRTGMDGIQFGQLLSGCEIYNNVIHAALNWKSPLGAYQDAAIQVGARDGGISVRNNIFIGAGQLWLNVFTKPLDHYKSSGTIEIDNNLFLYCRGPMGGYFGTQSGMSGISFKIRKNYFGRFEYVYDEVYSKNNYPNQSFILRIANQAPFLLDNNIWDGSGGKSQFYENASGNKNNVVASNNRKGNVPDIDFVNYMGFPVGFNYLLLEEWASKIGETWGDESQFPSNGTKKGTSVNYQKGDFVMRHSKVYKCIRENSMIEPGKTSNWENYWQLQIYSNGVTTPPDDVKLKESSFYKKLGMGLL